jgi:hypothetical protein
MKNKQSIIKQSISLIFFVGALYFIFPPLWVMCVRIWGDKSDVERVKEAPLVSMVIWAGIYIIILAIVDWKRKKNLKSQKDKEEKNSKQMPSANDETASH